MLSSDCLSIWQRSLVGVAFSIVDLSPRAKKVAILTLVFYSCDPPGSGWAMQQIWHAAHSDHGRAPHILVWEQLARCKGPTK